MPRQFSPRKVQEAARAQASGAVVRPCECGHSGHMHMLGRHECGQYDNTGAKCSCQKWSKPVSLMHPERATAFTDACHRWHVTDEDQKPMTDREADNAIQAVCEDLASQEGRWPNLDNPEVWHTVEALVLDRFGADPDAFTPDERNAS